MKVSSISDDCLTLEVETNLMDFSDGDVSGIHVEPDTKHMGGNISSCEEAGADLVHEPQKTELDSCSVELNGFSSETCTKEHGHFWRKGSASSDPEVVDSEGDSAEKGDNFVPIDVISNAVRTRRSILRRTSSTSTDESLGDENEFNGIPESPSKKNVRFNLNPNVRVFSNKKDKKKRKLEARLKAEARKHSIESEGSGSEQSNGTSPVDDGTGCNGFGEKSLGKGLDDESMTTVKCEGVDMAQSNINVSNDQITHATGSLTSDSESFGLTNNLIFEMDD